MATAEELLSGVLDGTSDSITVDSDLRKIIIPDSIRNIGVESDEEVLDLKISLPRYYGRYDLSEFKIWVSYLTANGEPDVHEVKETVIDEDTIAFIWQVGRHTTSYRGDVVFAFRLCKYFGHIILKEFNTTIATLPVLEGLQTGEAVVQNHSDLLEQWRIELFGLGDSKVQAIENAGDVELAAIEEARVKSVNDVKAVETNILGTLEEQRLQSIDDVHQKGVEVLASIPEDYTAMGDTVEMLKRFSGPVIRQETEGGVISVSDSSANPLIGLNIYGKSEQATTNGYQLFDASILETKPLGNHTVTNNGDGSFTISSTETISSAPGGYYKDYTHDEMIQLLNKPGTYTLSAGKAVNPYLYVAIHSSSGTLLEMSTRNAATITREITEAMLVDETAYLRLGFYVGANTEVTTGTIKPMFYIDGDGTWEPFSGGKPAPNPEYPQDIKSLGKDGNLYTGILGTNLIDTKSLKVSSNKNLDVSEDGYTVTVTGGTDSGWASSIYEFPTELVKMLRGKRVYSACDYYTTSQDNTGTRAGFNVTLADGTVVYPASIGVVNTAVHETINKNAVKIIFGIYSNNSGANLETDNVVTIKGLRTSIGDYVDWEEYKKFQSTIIPHELRGIPVTDASIANYIDSDGRMWICDEVDLERGMYVQRFNTYVITGEESMHDNGLTEVTEVGNIRIELNGLNLPVPFTGDAYNMGLCTHYNYRVTNKTPNSCWAHHHAATGTGRLRIVETLEKFPTIDDFKVFAKAQYAAGTPITITYAMATPIETPLTAEEIQAFKALHTNRPNTTILNDAGAHMKLAYAADTKIYIDNKFAELKAALTNS